MASGIRKKEHSSKSLWLQSLIALGVVFGDIGTSPLYAFRECFNPKYGIAVTDANVLGVLSLIAWTLFFTICIKYVTFVFRADNKGEGGVLSLTSLLSSAFPKAGVLILGVIGAALFFGDGIITPAISVLSAVEGLQIVAPHMSYFVIPLTLILIFCLFYFQRFGTAKIGSLFGPVLFFWFISIGLLGLNAILHNFEILKAINIFYALNFFVENQMTGFWVLGSVFLVCTGGEALYADMGHFGKEPIKKAWFYLVFPCLLLNYFGQGAVLLSNANAIENPFFYLAPKWGLLPLVILATIAAIIASQALISGLFSITKQAIQLGLLPRLNTIHTSRSEIGQIYLPFINYALMFGVLWLVLEFRSSENLAAAYGVAVAATGLITSLLMFGVATKVWAWSFTKSFILFGFLLVLDISFFITNMAKFPKGGWVAIVLGTIVYTLMRTWRRGRASLLSDLKSKAVTIEEFLKNIEMTRPQRVDGYAIFMSGDAYGVPLPMIHNLKHNKVLHENIMILTMKTLQVPFVSASERVKIKELGKDFHRVKAYFGFMERPNIYLILKACQDQGLHFPLEFTTFILGRETIVAKRGSFLRNWRNILFAFMSRNAERPVTYFNIPVDNVIEVGVQVEI